VYVSTSTTGTGIRDLEASWCGVVRPCLVRKSFGFLATVALLFLFDKYCLITE